MIGNTLGPYRILERIGRGGMATVYKAYQPSLDRYVAVKVLPAHLTDEPGFAQRFKREARAVAKLEHPHILPVHNYGQEGDLTYIAMRYVEGGTLKNLLGKPLELPLIVDLIGQIAEALDHAHEHGVVHRDVKPSNVLLDKENWAWLTDFGVARMVEATQQITATGVGVGTPAYMSPEQGQGKKVDRRSDVYSLGVMLYEMLTGRVPYEAETPLAVVWKHVNEPLPLPSSINPEIPEAVERVVLKAMAKDPDDRFGSAKELGLTLGEVTGEQEPQGGLVRSRVSDHSRPGIFGIFRSIVGRRPMLPKRVLGALALAMVLVGAVFVVDRLGLPGDWLDKSTSSSKVGSQEILEGTRSDAEIGTAAAVGPNGSITQSVPMGDQVVVEPTADLLFAEDFEDGKVQTIRFWGDQKWSIVSEENGNLALHVDNMEGADYISMDFGSSAWVDYEVSYQAQLLRHSGASEPALTMHLRFTPDPRTAIVFAFIPRSNEVVLAYASEDRAWERIATSSFNLEPGSWYSIQTTIKGFEITVKVDGNEIFNSTDFRTRSGFANLTVGPGTDVLLDDIKVIAIPAEQIAYDTFDDPKYDATINEHIWLKYGRCERVGQSEGAMTFRNQSAGCSLIVGKPSRVSFAELGALEARMQIASDHEQGKVGQSVSFSTDSFRSGNWWSDCGLIADKLGVRSFFWVASDSGKEDFGNSIDAEYDRWYTFRLDVDSTIGAFSCYVDGTLLGSIVPRGLEELAGLDFQRTIEAGREQDAFATTLVDFVRMAPSSPASIIETPTPMPTASAPHNTPMPGANLDTWEHITFNLNDPVAGELAIRRAIAYGTDRQALANAWAPPYQPVILNSFIRPDSPYYAGDSKLTIYAFDPRRSEDLLEEAGWIDRDGDGIREREDSRLELAYITTNASPERKVFADAFAAQMNSLGIELEVSTMPLNELAESIRKGMFQLAQFAWREGPQEFLPTQPFEPGCENSVLHSACLPSSSTNWLGVNTSRWRNAEVDAALDTLVTVSDFDEQFRVLAEIQRLFTAELPILPLFYAQEQ